MAFGHSLGCDRHERGVDCKLLNGLGQGGNKIRLDLEIPPTPVLLILRGSRGWRRDAKKEGGV